MGPGCIANETRAGTFQEKMVFLSVRLEESPKLTFGGAIGEHIDANASLQQDGDATEVVGVDVANDKWEQGAQMMGRRISRSSKHLTGRRDPPRALDVKREIADFPQRTTG
jgi:hypothetical protein